MLRLILLLLGTKELQKYWLICATIGSVFIIIGSILGANIFLRWLPISLHYVGYFLIVGGVASLPEISAAQNVNPRIRRVYAALLAILGLVIALDILSTNFYLAILCGAILFLGGAFQAAAAYVIQFQSWKISALVGALKMLLGIIFIAPAPVPYENTTPFAISVLCISFGISLIYFSTSMRKLQRGSSILGLWDKDISNSEFGLGPRAMEDAGGGNIAIHIWMPAEVAQSPNRHAPIVNRYIAAIDRAGKISTGHASIGIDRDIYISLYPGEEIEVPIRKFASLLRADRKNNVKGHFIDSYAYEVENWCDPSITMVMPTANKVKLLSLASEYKKNKIYNITTRNCSSTAALFLEMAVEGVWAKGNALSWRYIVQNILSLEFLAAVKIAHQARTMAWTPGLVCDYARALRSLTLNHYAN